MTPERLAEQLACKHEYLSHDESHCERCGMGSSSIVAVQRTRIRDLEAPPKCARECDRDGVGSPCIHELSPDELTGVASHVRDLEAQLAAARADVQTERNLFLRAQERVVILKAEVNEARDLICGITDTLEPYEGRLRVRGGWAKEFWGCIAEAEEYTRATTTPPSPEVGE